MPILDVLQRVPMLSFLPVVLLSFSAILRQQAATDLASIVLIFTSQMWHLVFALYQSLKTIRNDLREAAAMFGFMARLRLRVLELPFAAISCIWNSMISWAGGWFFLIAAEMFTVGQRYSRLAGLEAYLREAADRGDVTAIGWGLCWSWPSWSSTNASGARSSPGRCASHRRWSPVVSAPRRGSTAGSGLCN